MEDVPEKGSKRAPQLLTVSSESVELIRQHASSEEDRNSRTCELAYSMGEQNPHMYDLMLKLIDSGVVDGSTTEEQFFIEGYVNSYHLLNLEAESKNRKIPVLTQEAYELYWVNHPPEFYLDKLDDVIKDIEKNNPNFSSFLNMYARKYEINGSWEYIAFLFGGVSVHQTLNAISKNNAWLRYQKLNRGGFKGDQDTSQSWLKGLIRQTLPLPD